MRGNYTWPYLALFVAVTVAAPCAAQYQEASQPIRGVLENYLGSAPNYGSGAGYQLSWLHLTGAAGSKLGFTAGGMLVRGIGVLDETFLQSDSANATWRAGRLRSAFGLSDWSDQYYYGFVHLPLVRTSRIGRGLSLTRFDTGFDFQKTHGADSYQIGIVDVSPRTTAVLPTRPDHLVARFQTFRRNTILGLNLLATPAEFGADGTGLLDVDWRWSVPQVQSRGEFVTGRAKGGSLTGYYWDGFYHPFRLHRTTFLARMEGVVAASPDHGFANLFTLGVKQILSPQFTLEVSHAWGNSLEPAEYKRGWAVQVVSFTRF